MAFDGITTAAVVYELNKTLTGGGISRIVQSEKDELLLTIKSNKTAYRLLMSASASLPLIYLSSENKQAPLSAPNFCMFLRKHLQGGQILSVTQPSLERVIIFRIQHHDELGDLCEKKLIIELMGKYSNIILTDEKDVILDSIKRVPSSMSSVREVLPGRPYFIPGADEKVNPLTCEEDVFSERIDTVSYDIVKALYSIFTGLSPAASQEFIYEAEVEPRKTARELTQSERAALFRVFSSHMDDIKNGRFLPNVVYEEGEPCEYAAYPLKIYSSLDSKPFSSMSLLLENYYAEKEAVTRIRQKSSDLRHVTATALDRTNKKCALQEKQLQDSEKKEKYRIYGEMLNTYGYEAEEGAKKLSVINYYTNEPLEIPLDPTLTASQNAQHYFERYNKMKRTSEAARVQLEASKADRDQLEACLTAIDLAENEADLSEIRRELTEYGFVQRKGIQKGKVREEKSRPLSFISSDGFHMYVGKNNFQNEELTFKYASGNDWWFHAKGIPGSHVIVRCGGKEVPDRTFEEAGALAAWFSKGRKAPKVEIDYTLRRNLKKTNGGKPGFVIYHTNYSLMAVPDISGIRRETLI
ncbi:MAG TPA: NFACT RNA binding domain-containing protein [Lachnospiraceae bacterium]|nr:NFACT RNA binding domain-containing protein [Lachnospiraceae bacterium]